MITPLKDKVARTHAVEPAWAAELIYAPDTEWAEAAIAQSEVFPKGKHDDIHDSNTQAVAWMRKHGLLQHDFEAAQEEREAVEHKPIPKKLYDA